MMVSYVRQTLSFIWVTIIIAIVCCIVNKLEMMC